MHHWPLLLALLAGALFLLPRFAALGLPGAFGAAVLAAATVSAACLFVDRLRADRLDAEGVAWASERAANA